MNVTRLIYFSENQIDPARGSPIAQLNAISTASNRNNMALDLTGALVFDDRWFLQALEGERAKVWQTLRRIEDDERHSNIVVVQAGVVPSRMFGNWWMGLSKRDATTEREFAPFLIKGRLEPGQMTGDVILDLMVRLCKSGLSRKLAVPA